MKHWISLLFVVSAAAHAAEPCKLVRVGYSDRERIPYYIGNGADVPAKPGVLVELFRDAIGSAGCPVLFVRLPVARVRMALANGTIDIAPSSYTAGESHADYAVASTPNGEADRRRALRSAAIVFVRSGDRLPADTDPQQYFKTHTLAANQGTQLAAQLKAAGLRVDDGSASSWSNFDKLRLKRVDGFTVALMTPTALDPYLAEHHGKLLTRLEKPLSISYIGLGVSHDYYQRNRERVEAIWNWLGAHGTQQVEALTQKYTLRP